MAHKPGWRVYRIERPIEELGAMPGDHLVYSPTEPTLPFALVTHNPEFSPARLRACVSQGDLVLDPPTGRPVPAARKPEANARPARSPAAKPARHHLRLV